MSKRITNLEVKKRLKITNRKVNIERLEKFSLQQIETVTLQFRRFLFYHLDLSAGAIGIIGPRAVGKSILLRQLAYDQWKRNERVLLLDLADPLFSQESLFRVVQAYALEGGKHLFLDELHLYSHALADLIRIQSEFPDLRLVFSASAAGNEEGLIYDLSRIAELHYLPVLSFREFLHFRHGLRFPVIHFEELLDYNLMPGSEVYHRIRPLAYFQEYLARGAYPLSQVEQVAYSAELRTELGRCLADDIMAVYHMDYESLLKMNRILMYLASRQLFRPTIERMALACQTTRDSLLKFLKYLHKAGLVGWVTREGEDVNFLNKPDCLCLNDSNLLVALALQAPDQRAVYETFLVHQLKLKHQVHQSGNTSYLVDFDYRFELSWNQAEGNLSANNSYLIVDQAERKAGNRIPLWMLGFLY